MPICSILLGVSTLQTLKAQSKKLGLPSTQTRRSSEGQSNPIYSQSFVSKSPTLSSQRLPGHGESLPLQGSLGTVVN